VTFVIPKRDLELGYFKVVGEGKLEDTMDESGIDADDMATEVVVDEKFDEFWDEFCNWWDLPVGEEELSLKRGMTEYKLRCAWDDGTLVVSMVSPWPREWDYAQLYRGMFGWSDVGKGFYGARLRKKVAKLLLDEIIKRKRWMLGHGDAIAERERDIEQAAKNGSEEGKQMPRWFAEYRWTRSHSESGAGDMRLYVPGVDCLFGAPIMCEWAIQDMG